MPSGKSINSAKQGFGQSEEEEEEESVLERGRGFGFECRCNNMIRWIGGGF